METMRNFLREMMREHPFFLALFVVTVTGYLLGLGYAITSPHEIPAVCVNRSELAAQYWRNGYYKKQLAVYSTPEGLGAICFYEEPETAFSLTRDQEWGRDHLTGEFVEYLRHHPEMIDSPLITKAAREAFRNQETKPQ
jgi:hypothetical protein